MTERESMSNNTDSSFADAVAAARAGRRDDAARLLRQVVSADPFNVDAWLWLGGVAPEPREQRSALEQALTIAPNNQRAQQGLAWLRQSQPELFTEASTGATVALPRTERSTPSYQQAAVSSPADEHRAAIYPATSQEPLLANDAATQAFAVPTREPARAAVAAAPSQTDRMSTLPGPSYQQPTRAPQLDTVSTTDRMAVVPPPAVASEPVERYDRRGGLSRWLLVLIWAFSFGAVATVAALIIVQPNRFEPLVQPLLNQFGLRLVPEDVQTTAYVTALLLVAVAVIDAIVTLGLLMRGRWAWVVNLLVALLVTGGTIALLTTAYLVLPTLLSSNGQLILGGLALFTLIYLILSFTSRRAFFRRRIQSYGG